MVVPSFPCYGIAMSHMNVLYIIKFIRHNTFVAFMVAWLKFFACFYYKYYCTVGMKTFMTTVATW